MAILPVEGETVMVLVFLVLVNWIVPPFDDELGLNVSGLLTGGTIKIPVGSVCITPSGTGIPNELRRRI
jgi:hypothetical protein